MRKQYMTLECPFCKKGKIDCYYFPSSVKMVKGPYGGSKGAVERSADNLIVQTSKCPNCGKMKKEIEKALKLGVTKGLSHEERLKRLRESGLPTVIEG